MQRAEAIHRLKSNAKSIQAMGATSLSLFGSTARDEATSTSDLDILVDYDATTAFNALDLVGIKLFLEDALDLTVDIATRDGLHPRLRERIEQTAVRIF